MKDLRVNIIDAFTGEVRQISRFDRNFEQMISKVKRNLKGLALEKSEITYEIYEDYNNIEEYFSTESFKDFANKLKTLF